MQLLGYPIAVIPSDPCVPTPCGPNSKCLQHDETAVCSCLPNYIGRAPNCRPECTTNSECARNLACINERCVNPCIGTCGSSATCNVYNHQASCTCLAGYTGDPFSSCSPIPSKQSSRFFVRFSKKLSKLIVFVVFVSALLTNSRLWWARNSRAMSSIALRCKRTL